MTLHPITISITDGKGHVVLADQAHDQAVACRVELTFPLGAKPEEGFAGRERRITEEARLVLAAALAALDDLYSVVREVGSGCETRERLVRASN